MMTGTQGCRANINQSKTESRTRWKYHCCISTIFAGDGRDSCSDLCALNDKCYNTQGDTKGTPSVPRMVEPTFREGPEC